MTRSRLLYALLPALLLCLAAAPAMAEDEGQPQDTKAKIKAKMEKILKLMKANEKALLELSAGKDATPRRVDVDVPPPDGKGDKSGSPEGSSSGEGSSGEGSSGESAEDISKRLDELLRTKESGAKIPGELKELVEMIPT